VRLALISDIHGNAVALESVLADVERAGSDAIVCLGDVAQGGPQPAEALDRLAELACPVVLGNADAFLLEVPAESPEELTEHQLDVRAWTLSRLEPRHLDQIRGFAPTVELDGLLAFHGSPRSYDDVVLPETADDEAERLLGGTGAALLAGGHTHLQWARRVGDAQYLNPGSVGFPRYDFDTFSFATFAQWAVVEDGRLHFRQVLFDGTAVAEAGRAGEHPRADDLASRWGA
jgi:predicted phosphodiesterase